MSNKRASQDCFPSMVQTSADNAESFRNVDILNTLLESVPMKIQLKTAGDTQISKVTKPRPGAKLHMESPYIPRERARRKIFFV